MQSVKKEDFDQYMNAAQSAMFQYQLIEEGLKTCISMTHEIIRSKLPSEIDFSYKDAEFESMPLERLLNTYGKLTTNKVLVKQLNELRDSRNYVAHKAFALAFLSSVSARSDFETELKKVVAARDASIKGFMTLKEELNRVQALKSQILGSNPAV